jgi:menaquinone-dependent protoporphyrinogen oxidase
MSKRILVAYATGSGSTREVAQVIGATLAEGGVAVDVRAVQEVDSLADYSALVIGSSIRLGRWLPAAIEFVEDFADVLATRPVAYFTTCLTLIEDTEENRRTVMAYMEPVLALAPGAMLADIGLFAGSLDPSRRLIMPEAAGPHGDYRDWDAIRKWAATLRPTLAAATPVDGGLDLQNADLQDADLAGAELANADLTGADLSGADLNDANLETADLRDTALYWTQMADANLQAVNLEEGNLIGADLSGADLTDANLARAILNGCILTNANLRGANLSGADLHWADLSGADLRDANLQVAMLGWSDLSGADLTGATLSLAMYNEYTKWPEGFSPEQAGCRFVGGVR